MRLRTGASAPAGSQKLASGDRKRNSRSRKLVGRFRFKSGRCRKRPCRLRVGAPSASSQRGRTERPRQHGRSRVMLRDGHCDSTAPGGASGVSVASPTRRVRKRRPCRSGAGPSAETGQQRGAHREMPAAASQRRDSSGGGAVRATEWR